MQIILAKTAGFCFGVNRAVKLTYELLEQGRPVATLGPLIHNPQVVEDLESKGAITCDSVDDVPDGCEVVIRSHGVGQSVYDKISTRRLAYHDATCPFVTKRRTVGTLANCLSGTSLYQMQFRLLFRKNYSTGCRSVCIRTSVPLPVAKQTRNIC